ncbi:ABC transporter ATP-binding protein [Flavobacteriaceae bacterium]|nr:ABC transporter ATP-binding protein [Flavobacteriaceae bacterium]MDB9893290.1 ABC transporter ATP-binding protein [Flavobacteriaceae bacterium]MDB9955946.1 ABC transporter ATP-binding protein [Flavobacteriaceae bacterium]MDC1342329.1 ABC transporter ATP-binding protein [Flavobacteriaceae bacterium]|tara:strand:- start:291 stop:986 length:696 start_codon:yes stop_codon:yes gene_type:complete
MITIDTVSKKYGKAEVLNINALEIPTGQSFGLVGNNGAGKTTLFNILLDLIRPTTGAIVTNDISVHKSEAWKKFTGSFIDESFLISYLTPEEYFQFIGDLRGINKADVTSFLSQFEEFFNEEVLGKKKYLRDLSKGNQKKVGIVAAMMGDPKVVVLDEPFANLDPTTQIRLKKILKTLTENKEITVLVSSHDLSHVTEVCERIVVLDKGAVVKDIVTSAETLQELERYFAV